MLMICHHISPGFDVSNIHHIISNFSMDISIYIHGFILSAHYIYGWIATLLYRLEKKMDEKKFLILEIVSSVS
jgi:hypothetical protein